MENAPTPTHNLRGLVHRFDIKELAGGSKVLFETEVARQLALKCDVIIAIDDALPAGAFEKVTFLRGADIWNAAAQGRADEWPSVEVAQIHFTRGKGPGLGHLLAVFQSLLRGQRKRKRQTENNTQ